MEITNLEKMMDEELIRAVRNECVGVTPLARELAKRFAKVLDELKDAGNTVEELESKLECYEQN